MKRYILACAAVVACATGAYAADFGDGSPAWEQPAGASAVSGDVSFYGGALLFDETFIGDTFGVFGGSGRFAIAFADSWGLQGDVLAEAFFFEDFSLSQMTLLAHLYKMGPSGAIGVKVGSMSAGFHGLIVGGEGHLFLNPQLTLGADVNTTFVEVGQLYQARFLARFYPNPNLRLQAEGSWFGFSGGGPSDGWNAGASLAYRAPGSIFSWNAGAIYSDMSNGVVGTTKLTVGVTVNFDDPGSSMLSHDRQNVIFDHILLPLVPIT